MTIEPVSPEKIAVYRATAQQRWQAEQAFLVERHTYAIEVARKAAAMLKTQFGATQVWLFGSLVHGHWFSPSSDIDLAAWGIATVDYFRAVAWLQDISPDFSVDLVSMEDCKPTLRDVILTEGKPL